MQSEAIEDMSDKEPKLYKRLYLIKLSGSFDFKFDDNRDKPKSCKVELKDPVQIMFDFEGTVRIFGNRPEFMMGLVKTAQNNQVWSKLYNKLINYSDMYLSDDAHIKVGDYVFYLKDFNSKEDILGTIERKKQSWMNQLGWIEERLRGKLDTKGDDQLKDKAKVK